MTIVGTNEICRACATPSEKDSVCTPLFELSGPIKCISKDIIEIIEMLQLNFKQNDGLPQKICFSCLKTIAAISEFRKRCEDVQKILNFYYKSVPTASTRKNGRSHYAEKIKRLKKPNGASEDEKLDDFVFEKIKKKEEHPETRAPFLIGRHFSSQDEKLTRKSAVVYLKRVKTTNLELRSANCGYEESIKPTLLADNSSDACGNQIGNSEQVTMDSKADNYMQTEVDLKYENMKYGVEISEIEVVDESFLNEDDSHHSEQDLVLVSSDDDIEELNLNDTHWQCEFSIGTKELPPSNTIVNNEIAENTTTITKPKRKRPIMEKSQCPFCLRYYQGMTQHLQKCTEAQKKHRCKYCDVAFDTSSELNDHIEKMHPEGLPACQICFASFKNINQRAEHIRKEHKKVEIKCEKCDRIFIKKALYDEHMERRHTEIINKECSMCKKVIKTEFLFRRHMKQHEIADSLKCQYCGKMFTRIQFKLNHERLHTGETPYLCEICGLGVHSLAELHHHKKNNHYKDGKDGKKCRPKRGTWTSYKLKAPAEHVRFRCALCPRDFGTNYSLNNHLRKHTEDRKFICKQCGSGFKRLVHLKQHERRIHTTDKQFTCSECGKMFYEKHELNNHLTVHQEERPLPCPHCPATFKHKKRLRSHLRTHSSERPYVCHFCGNKYKVSQSLKAHFRTHTVEEIQTLEQKLVSDMEVSIAANKILEEEEENMIEEAELEDIECDYIIENV